MGLSLSVLRVILLQTGIQVDHHTMSMRLAEVDVYLKKIKLQKSRCAEWNLWKSFRILISRWDDIAKLVHGWGIGGLLWVLQSQLIVLQCDGKVL